MVGIVVACRHGQTEVCGAAHLVYAARVEPDVLVAMGPCNAQAPIIFLRACCSMRFNFAWNSWKYFTHRRRLPNKTYAHGNTPSIPVHALHLHDKFRKL